MTDDTPARVTLALDLINSYDPYLDQPETLATTSDLGRFLEGHGFASTGEPTPADLEAVRQVRARLWEAFLARHDPTGPSLLADLTQGALAAPVIGPAYALSWRLVDPITAESVSASEAAHTPLAAHLGAAAALGLATALQEHGPERLKSCVAAPCREVFIDTLRNRSRRFCGPGCANRFHVAAFRSRG